jgi:hypothetical protein
VAVILWCAAATTPQSRAPQGPRKLDPVDPHRRAERLKRIVQQARFCLLRTQDITRNEEEVSFGIRRKIQRKHREFQTAGRSWVSERRWSPAQMRCPLRDPGHGQAADVRAHPCKERGVVGPARDVAAAARQQMRNQPPLEVRRLQRSGSGAEAGAPDGPGIPG